MAQDLWYEKHRPSDISGYVWKNKQTEETVSGWLEKGVVPQHVMLFGPSGTGKSAIVHIIRQTLKVDDMDWMYIPSALENTVDVVRNKIIPFCDGAGWGGMRYVHLDESDRLSYDFQTMLRGVLTDYSASVRFLFTANYPRKIMPELRGRCAEITLDALDDEQMAMRMAAILAEEGGELSDDNIAVISNLVREYRPNLRKAINCMQFVFRDGKLSMPDKSEEITEDWEVGVLAAITKGTPISQIRVLVSSIATEDMESIFRLVYHHATVLFGENEEKAINLIATYMFRHPSCSFPEINICDMLLQLQKLKTG